MAWHDFVRRREWRTPADIRNDFRSADFVAGNRVVFNIGGNRYRLIAEINFGSGWIFVRFVGTHAEYDKVDAATVSDY